MSNEQKLLEIKNKISIKTKKHDEAIGALNEYKKKLKDEFQLKNITDAEKEIEHLDKEIRKIDNKIEHGLDTLEEKYAL